MFRAFYFFLYRVFFKNVTIIASRTTGSRSDYDNRQQVFNNKESNDVVDWWREGGMPIKPEACIPPPQREN